MFRRMIRSMPFAVAGVMGFVAPTLVFAQTPAAFIAKSPAWSFGKGLSLSGGSLSSRIDCYGAPLKSSTFGLSSSSSSFGASFKDAVDNNPSHAQFAIGSGRLYFEIIGHQYVPYHTMPKLPADGK